MLDYMQGELLIISDDRICFVSYLLWLVRSLCLLQKKLKMRFVLEHSDLICLFAIYTIQLRYGSAKMTQSIGPLNVSVSGSCRHPALLRSE